MKECGHRGCKVKIEEKYRFCYTHRKDKYLDNCYIHNRTYFSEGKCLKCLSMKKPIYRIYKRKNKYYLNKKVITKNNFIYPYCKQLTTKTIIYHNKYISRLTNKPGIYGIFIRDRSKKNQLGKCLYVGQSRIGITNRVNQHKKCLADASRQIKGIKSYYGNNLSWNKIKSYLNIKMEIKYYHIMYNYNLSDLKFVTLHHFTERELNKLTFDEINILLTCYEQAMIDVYKPSENKIAARPSH